MHRSSLIPRRLSPRSPPLPSSRPAPACRRRAGDSQPLQPIQVQVDHRRGVQRQHLAERQTAHHREAQRPAKLGSRPVPQHQRHTRQHRRQRRHQDRPEPQQARLPDRILRRHAAATFRGDREVHHHDAVLLHDADQQDHADQSRSDRSGRSGTAAASATRRRRPKAPSTEWSAAGCSSHTGCPG